MRANKIARRQLLLGHETSTGRPYQLTLNDFRRGAFLRGAIGSGKTTLLHRFLTSFGLQHNVVQFDFSGTGAFHFQAFLAQVTSLLAVAGRRVPLLRSIARELMLRHAFATLDDGDAPMPIRIDLLRPRVLATGAGESHGQVVDRAFLVLEMKLNASEPQIRVTRSSPVRVWQLGPSAHQDLQGRQSLPAGLALPAGARCQPLRVERQGLPGTPQRAWQTPQVDHRCRVSPS
jgi:hypothetical protein